MQYNSQFDIIGIAPVTNFDLPTIKSPLKWLDKTIYIRQDITKLIPWAKSLIIVGLGYNTNYQEELLYHPDYMSISKYAILREYHKVIPKKLKNLIHNNIKPKIEALQKNTHNTNSKLYFFSNNKKNVLSAGRLKQKSDSTLHLNDFYKAKTFITPIAKNFKLKYKIHSDTFPVFEKGYAQIALGGMTGYNNLWHSSIGTFVLLGGVITNIPFDILQYLIAPNIKTFKSYIYADSPFYNPSWQLKHNICHTCNKCIKACPTKALAPGKFKLYRCIGYWTAEHKGKIPNAIQKQMKNILFGCDICQNVCSFNKLKNFTLTKKQLEQRFGKVIQRVWHIRQLQHFSVHGFYKTFAGTPVMRMRYYKFKDRIRWYVKERRDKNY